MYHYGPNCKSNIEGMPFDLWEEGDPRSCPIYGHICPEFMEDFGLTKEELDIRATYHCGLGKEKTPNEDTS